MMSDKKYLELAYRYDGINFDDFQNKFVLKCPPMIVAVL